MVCIVWDINHLLCQSLYSCRPTEWPFYFGFILPFVAVYIFNWIVFVLIMISICKHKQNQNSLKEKTHADVIKDLKIKFIIALSLAVVLGLGWGFGLIATSSGIDELTFTFQIIFGIFVGSQGVLIFFLHGVRSEDFRKFWTRLVPGIQKRSTMSTISSEGHSKMYSKGRHGPDSATTNDKPTVKKEFKSESIALSDCSSIPEKSKRKSTTETFMSDNSSFMHSPQDSVFDGDAEVCANLIPDSKQIQMKNNESYHPLRKSSAGGLLAMVMGNPPQYEEINGMVIANTAAAVHESDYDPRHENNEGSTL